MKDKTNLFDRTPLNRPERDYFVELKKGEINRAWAYYDKMFAKIKPLQTQIQDIKDASEPSLLKIIEEDLKQMVINTFIESDDIDNLKIVFMWSRESHGIEVEVSSVYINGDYQNHRNKRGNEIKRLFSSQLGLYQSVSRPQTLAGELVAKKTINGKIKGTLQTGTTFLLPS